ncbi:MAG: PQQ-binding-like beta-propeller repeat protein [Chloroflexota bacterium]
MDTARPPLPQRPSQPSGRRQFLKVSGTVAALGAGSLLAGCQSSPQTIVVTPAPSAGGQAGNPGKPMFQMDAQHTGRSPHVGPRKATLLRTFNTTSVDTPEPGFTRPEIQSSAAIGPDGTIYIGNFPGNLFALRDPGRGDTLEMRWRFHPPGASSMHNTPALGRDGTVYCAFTTGWATRDKATAALYALKAPASGTEAQPTWSVDLGPGRQGSSPTLGPDGTIYVLNDDGKLFAVAPDGSEKWTAQTGPVLIASPALGQDGTVYCSSMDGRLYAVAPPAGSSKEGSVRWTFDFAQHLGPTPLVVQEGAGGGRDGKGSGASPTVARDGTIYVGANNSNFYAVAPDGKLKWLFEAEREQAGIWSTAALSADNSTLYFGANKGGIYAVNREDGKLRWQSKIFGSVFTAPALDNRGTLFTGSHVGHVFAIDSVNGQWLFDYHAGPPVWTAPSLRPDGTLVVGDFTGRVMLFAAG